ncbi:MAG: quinone-dependent dihydroorotate dehydrogenase [Bacteroidetes bacterium]|nr:quinone-dependent dihydroorotate dehydrogenase [Bacteroidota bacterium]
MFYPLLRKCLFLLPPETAHQVSMKFLKGCCSISFIQRSIAHSFALQETSFCKIIFGLPFRNPVGLGAGFDKNALYLRELNSLGFGFLEIGTVTPLPQKGNEKPRLFRLPKDKALINRMGFNNDGVHIIKKRLENWKQQHGQDQNRMIIGGNIGKNKITANEQAWKDYEICFNDLFDVVDYFTVNVSSPNTPGLRELQEKNVLKNILENLQKINLAKETPKPILLKIAPDLSQEQLNDIIELAIEVNLAGLVISNTTISRDGLSTPMNELNKMGNGGLSGKPVQKKSTEMLQYFHDKTGGAIPLIASGGIFTGLDASEKFQKGASLVQVWTGFIYEGPTIVKKILKHLNKK